MHDGSDTAYYLYRGFRVVAVEANPLLAESATRRFAAEIAAGRLVIRNVGLGPREELATFWLNEAHSEWSAFDKSIGGRDGTACHGVPVQCTRFRTLLDEFGVPFYLKLDIECNDAYCLEDLSPSDVPVYLSVEAHSFDYLCVLHTLGYRRFKCVNQRNHNDTWNQRIDNESVLRFFYYLLDKNPKLARRFYRLRSSAASRAAAGNSTPANPWVFPPGSSGPFGDEAFGGWESLDRMAYNWLHLHHGYRRRGTLNRRGWYDFHATK